MSAQVFGRDAELRTLASFADDLRTGPGALVLAGGAGAGKTTLLAAGAAAAAERELTVLRTMPAPGDLRLAFAGLADLLESCVPGVMGELAPSQARALRVALLLEEASARPAEPGEIAMAFRACLRVLSRSAPVMVVIDDVQWLDPPSAATVSFAIRRLAAEPVGLLCAHRSGRGGEELPLDLGRGTVPTRVLPVGRLSLGALHRVLRARLGTSFSRPTLRRIEAESAGNPFIALEIGRALVRRGISSVGTAALPVPDTLAGLVDERLAALPAGVLGAVRLAAVMPGAPVERYLAAGADAGQLDAAVVAGVLEPDSGCLRFSHPLLASAVTGSAPPALLRRLHAAAGCVAARPEERARHRALAADGASAEVAAELEASARVVAARGAPASSAELFELAAALTPAGCLQDERRRRVRGARELAAAGEIRAATAVLDGLLASMPPGPERADALSQLGLIREDDLAAAAALLQQAFAESEDDLGQTCDIHLALSRNLVRRGDLKQAFTEARLALADAEAAQNPALIASSLAQTFELGWMSGADVAVSLLARALELEPLVGGLHLHTSPSWVAGCYHLCQGNLQDAETYLTRVLTRAENEGVEYWRADALLRLSLVAVRRGDARRGMALAADALQIAEQLDLPHTTSAVLYACASAALLAGRDEEVRELTRRGRALACQAGDSPFVTLHDALAGSLELARGDYPAAAAQFGPLADRLHGLGQRSTAQGVEADAVEAFIAAGQLAQAEMVLTRMEAGARDRLTKAQAARCRGALAAAQGDPHRALPFLTEALRLHGQVSPMPLERVRTLLVLGRVQRRLNQRGSARATLGEALAVCEGTGAGLWAAQGRGELARISGRAPRHEDLTATERRVAELVASGKSNRHVAAELYVTVRAVESTLTKTYAKLGVRSRTELAAMLYHGQPHSPH